MSLKYEPSSEPLHISAKHSCDWWQVVYKVRVDPGFPMPRMIRRATSRAVANAALHELKAWVHPTPQTPEGNPLLGFKDFPAENGS